MAPHMAVALGGGDCETWRPGLLHQPVNALSSLAFTVAGVWVAIRTRADGADRVGGAVYAGALIGNGVGSFLYHGPGWPGSAFVHDVAIPAAVLFIAVEDVALLRGWTARRRSAVYALGLGAAGLVLAVVPTAAVAVSAAAAVSAVAAEVTVARRAPGAAARPPVSVAVVLGAAALAALAGRTGSPLCRPDGLLQGHALWHVLAAAALLGWDRVRRTRRAGRAGRTGLRIPVPWGGPASR
jgi:hypothetical protein